MEITPVVSELPDTLPLLPPSQDSDTNTECIKELESSSEKYDPIIQPRRSMRNRTQPSWIRSGEFELNEEEMVDEESEE